jgi:hypothetical protein
MSSARQQLVSFLSRVSSPLTSLTMANCRAALQIDGFKPRVQVIPLISLTKSPLYTHFVCYMRAPRDAAV